MDWVSCDSWKRDRTADRGRIDVRSPRRPGQAGVHRYQGGESATYMMDQGLPSLFRVYDGGILQI